MLDSNKINFKLKSFFFIIISGVLLLSFSGCLDDFKGIKKIKVDEPYNPAFAFPVAHMNISLLDMLKFANQDSLALIDSDYFMRFIYHGHQFKAYLRDYIRINDQTFNAGPFHYNIPGNDSVRVSFPVYLSDKIDHTFNFSNGEQITKLKIKSGKLIVKLSSSFRKNGDIDLKIDYAKLKNGSDFVKNIPFFFDSSGFSVTYDTIDLSGVWFDMSKGGISENVLSVNYTITLNPNSYYIRKTDVFDVNITFKDINFSYIEGFLGFHNINYEPDSMLINLFKNVEPNKIQFADPKLYIHFKNSAGLPVRIQPPSVTANKDLHQTTLSGSILNNPLDLNFPNLSEIGATKYTLFAANKQNSNIRDLLNMSPENIVFDLEVSVNEPGINRNNFATDSSYISVLTELELPLYGKARDYITEFDIDVDSFDMNIVEQIQLNLLSNNEIPIDFGIQFYLADTNRTILDSLISSTSVLIKSGLTDAQGKVIKPSRALTKITVTQDKIKANPDFKKIIIKASASTLNKGSTDVKIFVNNRLELITSLYFKLKIDLNK